MSTPWLWAYSDHLSARAGERVAVHVAGTGTRCTFELARLGRDRQVVERRDAIPLAPHPVPDCAHVGCGWPVTLHLDVRAEWPSGYYEMLWRGADGAEDEQYSRLVPPEDWGVLARAVAGHDSPENRRRLMRGHAVLATFRRGAGEVFNSGTTEWAYGLAARNPFVEQITRNVFARFRG